MFLQIAVSSPHITAPARKMRHFFVVVGLIANSSHRCGAASRLSALASAGAIAIFLRG
jgi:hypothetical protein